MTRYRGPTIRAIAGLRHIETVVEAIDWQLAPKTWVDNNPPPRSRDDPSARNPRAALCEEHHSAGRRRVLWVKK